MTSNQNVSKCSIQTSVLGMTIGPGNYNRHIIISPGSRAFESRNPGALYVALSRATSAGNDTTAPDFGFHPSILLNQDRVCHNPNTRLTRSRNAEIKRLAKLAKDTKKSFGNLNSHEAFLEIVHLIMGNEE